ncbi:hypothetical protein AN480_27435 (plasmid) [Mycobacterium intracellulare subsp. chimaera]|uniref:Helix-turn-helix domain-containing protein n=1 Tax=Mycobacterium intracellulare subsp. chimaera TaxID=222805 RepID=A0ABT7P368_MYCIT|nr:hypothetical protein [Mycobacterium intracellulare]AOS94823.1 hypothetical protein AN480_27435 [Mycobacterium intracellulare subsp. chimaera]MDM3927736.1 hypothetical protein [Mycobacterium intracellulare subsp. chimaera]
MEHFLSTGQAAEYLEITVDTLNSRIRAGNFPKPDALIGNRYQGWRQTTIERVRQLQRNQVRHLDIDTTQLVKSINTIRQVAEQTRAAAILATKHLATTGGIDPAAELLLTAARLENLLRATLCENRLGAALSGCKLGQSPKHVSQLQIEPLDIVDPFTDVEAASATLAECAGILEQVSRDLAVAVAGNPGERASSAVLATAANIRAYCNSIQGCQ